MDGGGERVFFSSFLLLVSYVFCSTSRQFLGGSRLLFSHFLRWIFWNFQFPEFLRMRFNLLCSAIMLNNKTNPNQRTRKLGVRSKVPSFSPPPLPKIPLNHRKYQSPPVERRFRPTRYQLATPFPPSIHPYPNPHPLPH